MTHLEWPVAVFISLLMAMTSQEVKPKRVEVSVWSASWCSACKSMEPAVSKLQANGTPVSTYDMDKQPVAAKAWAIKKLPTIIFVKRTADGPVELRRVQGVQSYEQLAKEVESCAILLHK
jgi:thiol-disulfide isomerase/thioredoxin